MRALFYIIPTRVNCESFNITETLLDYIWKNTSCKMSLFKKMSSNIFHLNLRLQTFVCEFNMDEKRNASLSCIFHSKAFLTFLICIDGIICVCVLPCVPYTSHLHEAHTL